MSFKNAKHFRFGFDFADVFAVQKQDQNLLPLRRFRELPTPPIILRELHCHKGFIKSSRKEEKTSANLPPVSTTPAV
jgi:hypothetical protein